MLTFLVVMLIVAAVTGFVAWPLRTGAPQSDGPVDQRLIDARDRALLAKERKLDEIRELRADRQAGKLANADAAVLERQLRAEAADLLHALDRAEAALAEAAGDAPAITTEPAPADTATDRVPSRTPEPLP